MHIQCICINLNYIIHVYHYMYIILYMYIKHVCEDLWQGGAHSKFRLAPLKYQTATLWGVRSIFVPRHKSKKLTVHIKDLLSSMVNELNEQYIKLGPIGYWGYILSVCIPDFWELRTSYKLIASNSSSIYTPVNRNPGSAVRRRKL